MGILTKTERSAAVEIHLNQTAKLAEVWLTNADQKKYTAARETEIHVSGLQKAGISGGGLPIRQPGFVPSDSRLIVLQPQEACTVGGCTGQIKSL